MLSFCGLGCVKTCPTNDASIKKVLLFLKFVEPPYKAPVKFMTSNSTFAMEARVTAENSSTSKSSKQKKNKKSPGRKRKSAKNSIETLHDAFIHELSDMQDAEKQLTKALPKMAKAASNPQLEKAFERHFKETEQQLKLVGEAARAAGVKLKREQCDAMSGLIEEGKEIIKNVKSGPVRDCLLIAAAQKVEHYEIAGYGTLVAVADQLGFTEAADILEQILFQEKNTDRKLNQLAEQQVNEEAYEEDEQDYESSGRGYRGGYDEDRYYSQSREEWGPRQPYPSNDRGAYGNRSYRSRGRSSMQGR